MSNPNPKEYAKALLWHLTGLRAEMAQTQFALIEIKATLSQKDPSLISQKWSEDTKQMHQKLYREALAAAQIDDDDYRSGPPNGGAEGNRK